MLLTLLIILVATDSSSQQSSRYQLYTRAAVSRYLERAGGVSGNQLSIYTLLCMTTVLISQLNVELISISTM